jgi:hypothetical protein
VKEVLTPEMIAAGPALLKALDDAGWPIVAAFWLYDLENNRWQLFIASPEVDEKGPLAGYQSVLDALCASTSSLALENVRVASLTHQDVRAIRSLAGRYNVEGQRLRTAIDRHWIEDAYVYRALPAPAA